MSYDLIVIGGGFAGLTAGNRAAELGLKALVLEASPEEFYACNSRYSTGALHVSFTPPRTDPAELYDIIQDKAEGTARPDLAKAIASRAAMTVEWLKEHGAAFENHPRRTDDMPMLAPLREMRAGLDWEGGGAHRLLQTLEAGLTAQGGELRRGVSVRRILQENGVIAGVEAESEIGAETLSAPAVLIADGGFQANSDLVRQHIGCAATELQRRNAGTARGEGLMMATELGAATVGMGNFYGHVLSRDAMTNEALWPYPQVDVICATSLVVNEAGQRIADEGHGGIYIANAIAKSGTPLGITAIFDAAVWEDAKTTDNVPPNPSLPNAGGTVIEAPTLEALAEKAGIDATGLIATIEAYNAHLANGPSGNPSDTLTPPGTQTTYTAQPVAQPPFYAIPVCAGITVTSGGIAINGKGQVMDTNDAPIPGLYAAGSAIGGLEGGNRAAYIGGLIKSFGVGLIAAETIAGL